MDWYSPQNFHTVLSVIEHIKNAGNHFYKKNDVKIAMRKYRKAMKYINLLREVMGTTDEYAEIKIREIEVPCCLNMAAVEVKRKNYDKVLIECEKVLGIDEENRKALFRRAQARMGQEEYDLAIKDLNLLKNLEPNDKNVLNELIKARKAKNVLLEKEKKIFQKMFA